MNNYWPQKSESTPLRGLALCLGMLGLATLLAGCGNGLGIGSTSAVTVTAASTHVSGVVHGGQQPIAQSTIQLYSVGVSGPKSVSAALIGSSVQSGSDGSFSISNAYSCTGATQVYIVATGGIASGATANSAIALAAALGPCSSLNSNTYITINEITTLAAAYALAPFAADYAHIGASGSNPTGLLNAFANAALLANTASGVAGGASVPSGVTVPVSEINTLGNIIAACVNTTGPSSPGCTSLLSATGASDTFGASLFIAKNPGASAVTALYTQSVPTAPFQPSQSNSSAPNDYSIAISATGGGTLATPYAIAIDAAGNAWIANETGTALSEVSPVGSLIATPTATGLAGAEGVAIDRSGNVWVANTAGNSVVEFAVTSGAVTGTSSYTAGGIAAPSAIALDSGGNAFVANFNGNSVSGLSPAGAALSGSPFTGSSGNILVPTGIAVGPTGSLYVTSGTGSIVNLSHSGAFVAALNDGTLQGPAGVAVDLSGDIFATGFTTGGSIGGALSQFTSGGMAVAGSPAALSGSSSPAGVASDGSSVWVANDIASGALAQFSYGSASLATPVASLGSLANPTGVAVDSSGSVWTTNSGNNTVSKFIGVAAPVATPVAVNVGP